MSQAYFIKNELRAYLYIVGNIKNKYALYFYEKGDKAGSIWYSNTNIFEIPHQFASCNIKVFERNENDELIAQYYVQKKIDSVHEINLKNILKTDIDISKSKIRYIYTQEDEQNYKTVINKIWAYSILDPENSSILLNLCSIEKSWKKIFNQVTYEASSESLNRKETIDAFIYFCFSTIFTKDWQEAFDIISERAKSIYDKDIANIANIFLSVSKYENNEYDKYCQLIEKFNKHKSEGFKHYICTPVATVYLSNKKHLDNTLKPTFLGKELTINKNISTSNKKYIISVSCNVHYFDLYGFYLINSFEKTCGSEAVLHIIFSDGDDSYYRKIFSNRNYRNVYYSIFPVNSSINIGPLSSLLRFASIFKLLDFYHLPVLVLDLDTVILKGFSEIIDLMINEKADLVSRILKKGVLPWEKYTGGFAFFNYTSLSIEVAKEIELISAEMAKIDHPQWWIDQNIFEAAIRQVIYRDEPLKIINAINFRDKYCIMPVGSSDAKTYLLNKAYEKIMNT